MVGATTPTLTLANSTTPNSIDIIQGYPSDSALITATCQSNDICQISYNGASHASGTTTATLAYNSLPSGYTTVYANDITSSVVSTNVLVRRIPISHIAIVTLTHSQSSAVSANT